jgi:hypothetical protein
VSSKEALALEKGEVSSLQKALAKEQETHALTKKENNALKKKYCDLDEKHKELELQYNLLWESNSQPLNAKDTSTPSTSQGYKLNLNAYTTNLANMKTMRKEITRLNEVISKGCLSGKAQVGPKVVDEAQRPKYKEGRHPSIKHGLGYIDGAKTNGKKIINGYECVRFERKGKIGTERSAQTAAVPRIRAVVPRPTKMGRPPILFLIKLSPRSRHHRRSRFSRNQRNQCGALRTSMHTSQGPMHLDKA